MTKLKCWKKMKGGYAWLNKKDLDKSVLVEKAPREKEVSLFINEKEKRVKSIKEALKFANKYMKQHDKC